MSSVISVENLGKRYLLTHQAGQGSYLALRDVLSDSAKKFGRRLLGRSGASGERRASQEEFWALRDISFEVGQGDRIGIIGRNGAGKSTLLKILSRITEPSTGSIRVRGRVASLLEVGTGFHPELTGRENIFLNGAILGMSRSDILRKFDAIVDFAEVERFLDTPVKRYSSGMYVRLAFAVAGHLEPDILVVDEVLAVGDAAFQKKCLGKMAEVSSQEGRTVLFVSHNMAAISALTNRCIVLDSGRFLYGGPTPDAVACYEKSVTTAQVCDHFQPRGRTGSGLSRITDVSLVGSDGEKSVRIEFNAPFRIHLSYQSSAAAGLIAGFTVVSSTGLEILTSHSDDIAPLELKGEGTLVCTVDPNCLSPGRYYLRVAVFDALFSMHDRIEQSLDFEVVIRRPDFVSMVDGRPGAVRIPLGWERRRP